MEPNTHRKIAGILQLAQGIPNLLFWGGMSVVRIILDLKDGAELSDAFELKPTLILAAILLGGAIETWLGIALLRKKKWVSRAGGFICCLPSLWLNVLPPGPLHVGAYTIWVLTRIRKDDALSASAARA